jgi:BCD family chlorophyll transporter-like MFS transporter
MADLARPVFGDATGFGAVFLAEAALFLFAAALALRLVPRGGRAPVPQLVPGE